MKSITSQSSCFVDLTHLYFPKFLSSGGVFSHHPQTVVNPAKYPQQLPDILCCTGIFCVSSRILLGIMLPFERMWCWIRASHQAVSGSAPLWCVLFQQPGGLEVNTKGLLTTAAFRKQVYQHGGNYLLIYREQLFLSQPPCMTWCDLGKADIPLSLCWSGVAMETGGLLC